MEKVDVLIAGAGIAGPLAAHDLARAGHSVLLLERMPEEKLGHDWWDSVELCVFDEVGLPQPEPPERMVPTGPVTVYSPLETTSFYSEALSFKANLDRKLLAKRLIGYAKDAGARFMDRTAIIGPIVEGGKVEGAEIRTPDGNRIQVRAKLTIDATGMAAAIRKQLPEQWGFPRQMRREDMFVTYREIRENTGDASDSMLVFGKNNGVQWIKRAQKGTVDYFSGVINETGRVNPRAMVGELLSKTTGYGNRIIRGGYGAPIPVRKEFNSLVMNGFMLCGDSGCQCCPIDGSGIVSSLRAAHFAAKTALTALDANRFDEEILWPYNAYYKRAQGGKFAKLDMLQKFMVSEKKEELELLFTKGIISDANFRQDAEAPKPSKLSMLGKVLKIAGHPGFMMRLIKTTTTMDKLEAHYGEFPEKYDRGLYELWQAKADKMFSVAASGRKQ